MAPKQVRLTQLRRGGMTNYVILKVVRRWDTIYPTTKKFPSIDFVFVDNEGNAIHGLMEPILNSEFDKLLCEGGVYRIENFEVKGPKPTHNAVSFNHTIHLNWSTVVTEFNGDVSGFPDHYFSFATMEDIKNRKNSDRVMTDVVGMLVALTKPNKIKVKNQNDEVDKQTLHVRLLSGEEVKICLWSSFLSHVDFDSLVAQQPKPVLVVAGTTVKKIDELLALTTTTGTKIFVDLDIPETAEIIDRFKDDHSAVSVLAEDKPYLSRDELYKDVPERSMLELLNCSAADIGASKFRIKAIVRGIDTSVDWYYAACGICRQALTDDHGVFYCTKHELQTPQCTLKIPLVIKDETARMRAMIFGDLAEEITGIKVGNVPMLKKKRATIKLPDEAFQIVGNVYSMVLGLSQQAQIKDELNFKVFDFTFLEGTEPLGAAEKGKAPSQPTLEEGVQDLALRTPEKKLSSADLEISEVPQVSKTLTPEKRASSTNLEASGSVDHGKGSSEPTGAVSAAKKFRQGGASKKLNL